MKTALVKTEEVRRKDMKGSSPYIDKNLESVISDHYKGLVI